MASRCFGSLSASSVLPCCPLVLQLVALWRGGGAAVFEHLLHAMGYMEASAVEVPGGEGGMHTVFHTRAMPALHANDLLVMHHRPCEPPASRVLSM